MEVKTEVKTRCTYCHEQIGTATECIRHCIKHHAEKQISVLVPRDEGGNTYVTKRLNGVNGEPLLGKKLIDDGLDIDEVYIDPNWNLMLPTTEACHSPPRKIIKIDLPTHPQSQ